jgi:hypothetical protein
LAVLVDRERGSILAQRRERDRGATSPQRRLQAALTEQAAGDLALVVDRDGFA